jgi:carboxylesterase
MMANTCSLTVKKEHLFLLIHGYGSAPEDLLPLAYSLNKLGFNCALVLLKGHAGNGEDLLGLRYRDWYEQVKNACRYYHSKFKNIYLIGFSLGGTLSLDFAADSEVAGVVSISTFLKPTPPANKMIKIMSLLRFKYLPRWLQVTKRSAKHEIVFSKTIPIETTENIIDNSEKTQKKLQNITCPILLLHSADDKVSDYSALLNALEPISHKEDVMLITFRALKHFIQFDMPSNVLASLVEDYFISSKSQSHDESNKDLFKEAWAQASAEQIHWSDMVFKLIVGFFSVFGTMLYFSLPHVFRNESSAPYFLIAYSIITSIFTLLVSLYFFYINRVNVFLKYHIEPNITCPQWTSYRTNKYVSGKESEVFTKRISLAVIGLPLAICIYSITYTFIKYKERFFINEPTNIPIIFSMTFAALLFLGAVRSLILLLKYTNRELYKIEYFKDYRPGINNSIRNLLSSVNPGSVKQPLARYENYISCKQRDVH